MLSEGVSTTLLHASLFWASVPCAISPLRRNVYCWAQIINEPRENCFYWPLATAQESSPHHTASGSRQSQVQAWHNEFKATGLSQFIRFYSTYFSRLDIGLWGRGRGGKRRQHTTKQGSEGKQSGFWPSRCQGYRKKVCIRHRFHVSILRLLAYQQAISTVQNIKVSSATNILIWTMAWSLGTWHSPLTDAKQKVSVSSDQCLVKQVTSL